MAYFCSFFFFLARELLSFQGVAPFLQFRGIGITMRTDSTSSYIFAIALSFADLAGKGVFCVHLQP